MSQNGLNLIMSLAFASVVGYFLYRLIDINHKLETSWDFGRKFLAVIVGIVSISTLPKFFRLLDLDSLLKFFICIVSYGILSYVAGWCYGNFFQKNKKQTKIESVIMNKNNSNNDINTKIDNQDESIRSKVSIQEFNNKHFDDEHFDDVEFDNEEESIYNAIYEEIETGNVNKALWTKLFALHDGDTGKIKSSYIRARYKSILNQKTNHGKQTDDTKHAFLGEKNLQATNELHVEKSQGIITEDEQSCAAKGQHNNINMYNFITVSILVLIPLMIYLYRSNIQKENVYTQNSENTSSVFQKKLDNNTAEDKNNINEKGSQISDSKSNFSEKAYQPVITERLQEDKNEKYFADTDGNKALEDDVKTQRSLGDTYFFSFDGSSVDKKKAFFWYEKAAYNGDALAQGFIGDMYESGDVVEKNYEKAYIWYSLAVIFGEEWCKKGKDRMERNISAKSLKKVRKEIDDIYESISTKRKSGV